MADRPDAREGVDVLRVAEKHAPEVVYLVLKETLAERDALADRVAALEAKVGHYEGLIGEADDRVAALTEALAYIAAAQPSSDDAATVARCFYRVGGEARAALAAHAPLSDTTEETRT